MSMVQIRIEVLEVEENDREIVVNDILDLGAKNLRFQGYNDNRESFLFTCEVEDESRAERFADMASQILLCNTKIIV